MWSSSSMNSGRHGVDEPYAVGGLHERAAQRRHLGRLDREHDRLAAPSTDLRAVSMSPRGERDGAGPSRGPACESPAGRPRSCRDRGPRAALPAAGRARPGPSGPGSHECACRPRNREALLVGRLDDAVEVGRDQLDAVRVQASRSVSISTQPAGSSLMPMRSGSWRSSSERNLLAWDTLSSHACATTRSRPGPCRGRTSRASCRRTR